MTREKEINIAASKYIENNSVGKFVFQAIKIPLLKVLIGPTNTQLFRGLILRMTYLTNTRSLYIVLLVGKLN